MILKGGARDVVTSLGLADVVAKALGVPGPTVVQHLRNLQKDGRIAFKGYGRGAARMGPRDAASLLLAAAGDGPVKDSLATLDAFGSLRMIHNEAPASGVTFLDHLTGLLTRIATKRLTRDPGDPPVAFTLISAATGTEKGKLPRFVFSSLGLTIRGTVRFGPEGWDKRMRTGEQFAALLSGSGSGLARASTVTMEALEKVAGRL